jgi:hypothetical protein
MEGECKHFPDQQQQRLYEPLELSVERLIIQEDIWIVVMSIEPVFELFDRFNHTLQIAVSGQDDKGSIGFAGRRRSRVLIEECWFGWRPIVLRISGESRQLVLEIVKRCRLAVFFMRESKDVVQTG